MHHRHWFMDISCAVAAGALCDYVQVWEMVDAVVLQPACRSFFIGMSNMPGARAPWSCSSGLRFRNGCERAPEGNYITSRNRICAPWVENVDHSLMNRLLAREAWDRVLAPLGLRALLQALNSKILVWWLRCRTYQFTQVLWKGLDTLILMGCWILWMSGIREFSEEGRARGTCV